MELNEKIMTVVAIGMAVLGLGEAYAIYKVSKTSKEVQAFNAAVDEVSQITKWSEVKTKLKDLNTSKLHYVKVPKNLIVIDFDIKDENGEKSLYRC